MRRIAILFVSAVINATTIPAVASISFSNSSSIGTWITLLVLLFAISYLIKLCNLFHITYIGLRVCKRRKMQTDRDG